MTDTKAKQDELQKAVDETLAAVRKENENYSISAGKKPKKMAPASYSLDPEGAGYPSDPTKEGFGKRLTDLGVSRETAGKIVHAMLNIENCEASAEHEGKYQGPIRMRVMRAMNVPANLYRLVSSNPTREIDYDRAMSEANAGRARLERLIESAKEEIATGRKPISEDMARGFIPQDAAAGLKQGSEISDIQRAMQGASSGVSEEKLPPAPAKKGMKIE